MKDMNDAERNKLIEEMTISVMKSMEPYNLLGAQPVDYLATVMRIVIMMLTADCLDRMAALGTEEPIEVHIDETVDMIKENVSNNVFRTLQARDAIVSVFGDVDNKSIH